MLVLNIAAIILTNHAITIATYNRLIIIINIVIVNHNETAKKISL